jgi:hypothetical protein
LGWAFPAFYLREESFNPWRRVQSQCDVQILEMQIRMIKCAKNKVIDEIVHTIDVGKVKNEKVKKQKSKVLLPRELHLLGQSFFNATITFFSHVTEEDGISYLICKFQCKGCGKMIKPSILTSAKKKDEFVWKFQTGKYFILPSDIYDRCNHKCDVRNLSRINTWTPFENFDEICPEFLNKVTSLVQSTKTRPEKTEEFNGFVNDFAKKK